MKRIIFDVPKWSIYLHRRARGLSSVDQDDPKERQLEDELFERLYAGPPDMLAKQDRTNRFAAWATKLHATCDKMPDFSRLASECRGDSDAAAIAVETIMDELRPSMNELAGDEARLRGVVRTSCTHAASVVEELKEAAEGLEQVSFGGQSATGLGSYGTTSGDGARVLMQRLRTDPRLRRIAELAGRFKRIGARKQRSKVRHGADEIADVELGSDIGRLLPVELGKLMTPGLRLAMLRDLLEHRCLVYQVAGKESLGKGPLILAVDKSGSMEGEADVWATAVALALLDVAHRERRPFGIVAFNSQVKYETVVMPGEKLPEVALFTGCSGGTDIHRALERGLDIIHDHPGEMKKADIVLITDGASDPTEAEKVRLRAAALGATIVGVGIGVAPEALQPWCHEAQTITDLGHLAEGTAETLFAA